MRQRERVYKPLTLKLSSIESVEARARIEQLFEAFNAKRTESTIALRQAAIADAKAGIVQQEMRMAFVETIDEIGKHSPAVNNEQVWTLFRDKDGELTFECPFTEADQRNAMRAQRANMEHSARQLGSPVETLYDGEDNEPEERVLGFGAAKNRTERD
jgi:hypothetical protein